MVYFNTKTSISSFRYLDCQVVPPDALEISGKIYIVLFLFVLEKETVNFLQFQVFKPLFSK